MTVILKRHTATVCGEDMSQVKCCARFSFETELSLGLRSERMPKYAFHLISMAGGIVAFSVIDEFFLFLRADLSLQPCVLTTVLKVKDESGEMVHRPETHWHGTASGV